MFTAGSVTSAGDVLAMNFLMDRDAEHRARDFAALKAEVGACDTAAPIVPTGALAGDFTWSCEHGRVQGAASARAHADTAHSVAHLHPLDACPGSVGRGSSGAIRSAPHHNLLEGVDG